MVTHFYNRLVTATRGRVDTSEALRQAERAQQPLSALGVVLARHKIMVMAWIVVIGFALSALIVAVTQANGPFIDEGLYITAGIRTLQGYASDDGYLSWISGSLFWPVAAALAYRVGGLIGARILALLCVTAAIAASVDATRLIYGRRAALGAAIALSLSGPALSLSQLAVYDQFALVGVGVAFWAIAKLATTDNQRWTVIAAIAFSLGVISKYPMALCALPLLLWLAGLRKRRALLDMLLFGIFMCLPWLILLMPYRSQLATFLVNRLAHNPGFGYTEHDIIVAMFVFAGPQVALAIVGAALSSGRWLAALAQVAGVTLWPAYHILVGNYVSSTKHIVFGFVLAGPLMGIALVRMWNWSGGWLPRLGTALFVLLLASMCVGQFTFTEPTVSSDPASYLVQHVQPGQQLLISNGWPYRLALYSAGRINSPWDVVDADSLSYPGHSQNLCSYDWYVSEQNGYDWPQDVQQKVAACGVYVEVYSSTIYVTRQSQDMRLVTYPFTTTIWRNVLSVSGKSIGTNAPVEMASGSG